MESSIKRSNSHQQDDVLLPATHHLATPSSHDLRNRSGSSSSFLSDNYTYESSRMYEMMGDVRRKGSLSPADSISSIHEAYYLNDRIRCLESEKLALMIDHNNLIREFNKRMESHLEEIKHLKETNHQIEQEAHELRDLSCFLDDDRQKCRKLAKEWQRFGKHTVSVMRTEVMSYQEKLRSLETRQAELIKENGELRDLCVYLDNQRTGITGEVNEAMMKYSICRNCSELKKDDGTSSSSADYAKEHVVRLQNNILQLEKEKDTLHKLLMYGGHVRKDKKRVSFTMPDEDGDSSSTASEVDRLDFPPHFGSSESLSRPFDQNSLRNNYLPNFHKSKSHDISPRNSDVSRVDDNLTNDQMNELKEKLSKSTSGAGYSPLSEHEISLLKDMCHIRPEKLRSDINTSSSSLNNSFDTSPLSPPPNALGLPLYNTLGRRSSKDLLLGGASDLSIIAEKSEPETANDGNRRSTMRKKLTDQDSLPEIPAEASRTGNSGNLESTDKKQSNEGRTPEEDHMVDMTDLDELMESINKDIAGSLQQLNLLDEEQLEQSIKHES